jgi:hypothetical protein
LRAGRELLGVTAMPVVKKLVLPVALSILVLGAAGACGSDELGECFTRATQDDCDKKTDYACIWDAKDMFCEATCGIHEDKAACGADPGCEFTGTSCVA